MQTYNRGYDIYQLLEHLKAKTCRKTLEKKKKIIYVGMTRATHLLCLAVHKEHVNGKKNNIITPEDIEDLEKAGFDVRAI